MKGIICYYSGSGNTKLACEYIKGKINNAEFILYDIVKNEMPDFSDYDIVGFATFTDFGGVPFYFHKFFEELKPVTDKYAFVFNTYGFISGITLRSLAELATHKGFDVISGHSLHTPENYPPARVRKMGFDHAPKPKYLEKFNEYIHKLDAQLEVHQAGVIPTDKKIKIGFFNSILPRFARTKAKQDYGKQFVVEKLCTECGVCKEVCPYGAIELAPKPVFDHGKCYGCWACYNHCPESAIHTKKFKGIERYSRPNGELMEKLRITTL